MAVVRAAIDADVPVLCWGAPGTGKTAALRALARDAGAHVEVLIGASIDPADVAGVPVPDAAGDVRLAPPAWARRLRAAIDRGESAWLFLDEFSCAPPSVQAALLRVVLDRAAGDVDLDGCRVIAAANPADTAADGGVIPAATANRWCHVPWHLDATDWCAGELRGWGATRTAAHAAAAASVAAWIARSPTALLAVPQDVAAAGVAWPSPRSWSAAARIVGALGGVAAEAAEAAAGGCVGAAAAAEWIAWAGALDIPDPESVLSGATTMPARPDRIAAAAAAVVAAAIADRPDRPARIRAAWRVLATLRPDQALIAARALLAADPTGAVPDEAAALGGAIIAARAAVTRAR